MKCPHCREGIHESWFVTSLGVKDRTGVQNCIYQLCPECENAIIYLFSSPNAFGQRLQVSFGPKDWHGRLVHPRASSRPPCPDEVTENLREDYQEACLTLSDSPKASAALSRRCLQNLLRQEAKVKHGTLAAEIQEVIGSGSLPSYLRENVDAVRNIGNLAAHPITSQHTGEIVPVEPEEAEWNLDVLEGLFDLYFVQPALMKKKRSALNKKLSDAGKPQMKG